MKCQFCSNTATVHVTNIVNLKKRQVHLCEDCARQYQILPEEAPQELNIPALLQFLIGQPLPASARHDAAQLACPA
jgi:protein arginine kinase activator